MTYLFEHMEEFLDPLMRHFENLLLSDRKTSFHLCQVSIQCLHLHVVEHLLLAYSCLGNTTELRIMHVNAAFKGALTSHEYEFMTCK